ncbi:hypothetical protein [Thermaerobacillus caldiproteolyticus]|uniref:hypothetical protein n=1 Tax=Thermaerobacillus caldiproteolyticus TaxID=247480 RepID=UPI00188D107B|nr:hypothetical protein [Anoxybacillus caldiproteolyticus]QPA32331.1 hypothetical protein ISX45_04990 [Anoxybacillus caldiproteolyticus]
MKKVDIRIFISFLISFGILSLAVREIQWLSFLAALLGYGISRLLKARKKKLSGEEIEYDERVNDNIRTLILMTFLCSNFLLLLYLVINDCVLHKSFIKINYLTLYIIATFFIGLFIMPTIAKRR